MAGNEISTGGHTIEITHPEKLVFPASGITKAELVDYYREIAPVAIPHLAERPLIMEQYPAGIAGKGFFHRTVPDYYPSWIDRIALRKVGGKITEVIANDAATLVYLAEQNCVTLHAGLSRRDRIDYPDRMIIDLDPSIADFGAVQSAARRLKALLDELELSSFVQITGSRGMHVVVPLDRTTKFQEVHAFARELASALVVRYPRELTIEQRKNRRGKKLFLDFMRNSPAQTAVAPYSVRAREGAPVAAPLTWSEACSKSMTAQKYNIKSILRRLSKKDDPWAKIDRSANSLDRARRELSSALGREVVAETLPSRTRRNPQT
jgi:bifunctional non-homologous end joining protein LigD